MIFQILLKKISDSIDVHLNFNSVEDLRRLMFEQYDFLSKINQISENKLSKEKISNNFSTDELISPIKNFYMTDS